MKQIFTLCICAVMLAACAGGSEGTNDSSENSDGSPKLPVELQRELSELNESLKQAQIIISNPSKLATIDKVKKAQNLSNKLIFYFGTYGLDSASIAYCNDMKEKAEVTNAQITEILNNLPKTYFENVIQKEDYVMEEMEAFPVYLERGDKLFYTIEAEDAANVKIYNVDSKKLEKGYNGKKLVKDSMQIKFKGVYLVEIVPKNRQHINIEITYRPSSLERLTNPQKIETKEVEGKKGDFRVKAVQGIAMKNLFEEPRKFTLREGWKAMFSGSKRAIVAIQVPSGASDIFYSLRISTNEGDRYSDGEFYNGMERSYKKIKMLGLPVYETKSESESHKGSSIISTLLGDNKPIKEGDAYINMYVFTNSAQAKKFQDGADVSNLSYNIDYTTLGTQSCNGRIPAKGCKVIYLGFENERMRYTNYVWLEAISSVLHTEYFKTEYTVVNK